MRSVVDRGVSLTPERGSYHDQKRVAPKVGRDSCLRGGAVGCSWRI